MDNLLDILNKSVNYLDKKKIENARLTVEKIFSEILNIQRNMHYANIKKILKGKKYRGANVCVLIILYTNWKLLSIY